MADSINNLPVDNSPPNHDEVQVMNTIFKENISTMDRIVKGLKNVLIVAVILYILLLPQTMNLLEKYLPSTSSSVYLKNLVICVMFVVIFVVVDNFHLSKKGN